MNMSSNLRYFSTDILTQHCWKPIVWKIISSQPFPQPTLIIRGWHTARNKLFSIPFSPGANLELKTKGNSPTCRKIHWYLACILNMARSMHSALWEIQTIHKTKRAQMIPDWALHRLIIPHNSISTSSLHPLLQYLNRKVPQQLHRRKGLHTTCFKTVHWYELPLIPEAWRLVPLVPFATSLQSILWSKMKKGSRVFNMKTKFWCQCVIVSQINR